MLYRYYSIFEICEQYLCVCVCACVLACVRECVYVCVYVYMCVWGWCGGVNLQTDSCKKHFPLVVISFIELTQYC